jgi:hypothetical protein
MLAKRLTRICAALAAVTATAFGAAGCGAPEYEYVKNSDQQTYFKVPGSWHRVDQAALDEWVLGETGSATARLRKDLIWSVAYDAAAEPEASHVYGFMPTTEPVVWAKVERLVPSQSDVVSFDVLRDLVLPVTEGSRKQAEAGQAALEDFELLHDEVLTPEDGLHGVRVVYNYRLPTGVLHTFDQTALANNDSSLIYLLFVRCSATCYSDRAAELQEIVKSFTVRSK